VAPYNFQASSLSTFNREPHKALVQLLKQQRKARKLSLRKVVKLLPPWLKFEFQTLHKIEAGRRNVTYTELREIARVLGTSVAALDGRVDEIVAAKEGLVSAPVGKKR